MTGAIVTTHHRYKRPSRKRAKAAAIEAPSIVTAGTKLKDAEPAATPKPAIVTARRPRAPRNDVRDLTPEELQRRADAAGALWRELVRRATGKDQS